MQHKRFIHFGLIGVFIFVLGDLFFGISNYVSSQSAIIVERVSVNSGGSQANNMSSRNDINADGRYVVFASLASNLVDGDTNGNKDIFLMDRLEGTVTRVSKSTEGVQGNGESDAPVISADGRYIAYESYASNLIADDTNGKQDIFLYDLSTEVTIRVSVSNDDSESNDHSFYPAISSDGQMVSFQSAASNLVAGDSNGVRDVFVRDHVAGITERVSISTAGDQANGENLHPSLSEDGRYVVFTSSADNLLPYVPAGLVSGTCTCVDSSVTVDACVNSIATCSGATTCGCILEMVPQDDNGVSDIYLRDRVNMTTTRISIDSTGKQANGGSAFPAIDDDGSYVAFESVATNLVTGDTNGMRDVFVYNRQIGETTRVSVATDGTQANNSSGDGVDEQSVKISADGQYVVFKSRATNLVANDTNGQVDVFVHHQRESFITTRVSVTHNGAEANSFSYYPSISSDGQYITYYSYATNIVPNDTNGFGDIFVYNQDSLSTTPTPTSTPFPTDIPIPTATSVPLPNPITVSVPANTIYPTEVDIETPVGLVTVRCEQVTRGGTISVYVLTSPPGQLDGRLTTLRTNFDITSSVLQCSTMTVCLPYYDTEVTTALLNEDELEMYHYNGGNWNKITSYRDVGNNSICGQPRNFSPFVIGNTNYVPSPTPNNSNPTPTLGPNDPTYTPTPTGLLPKSGVTINTVFMTLTILFLLGLGVFLLL